jgi:hypothetical protein
MNCSLKSDFTPCTALKNSVFRRNSHPWKIYNLIVVFLMFFLSNQDRLIRTKWSIALLRLLISPFSHIDCISQI